MAFLRYSIDIVGREKVTAAMRAIESEVLASNRRTVARATTGARRGVTQSRVSTGRAELAAHEKLERAKTAATERELRKRAADEIREAKRVEAAKASLQRQRSSALMAQYRAEERAQARAKAEYTRGIKGALGGTVSRVGSVARGGVALTGLAGGAIAGAAIHGAMAKGAAATELANQLEQGKSVTAASLAQRRADILRTTSMVRGFSQEDVMSGMSAFQGQAGESDATMKAAPLLAKTSLATGSDITGIGEMYSAIYASLRNATGGAQKSVDELLKQTDEIGTVFAAMGQIGAIELKDFQRVGADIAAAGGKFAGDPAEAIKNAAAAAQLARQSGGSKSAEEAATALRSFGSSVASKTNAKTGQLMIGGRAVGESIFTDSSMTQLKSLPDVIAEVMAVTGGNIPQLQELTGERGADITRAVSSTFLEATGGKRDKASLERGREAVKKQFEKFGGVAMGTDERELKAAARLSDADKQLEEQMRKLTSAVGNELLPTVTRLIPEIAKLIPLFVTGSRAFADFIRVFASNPLSGVGVIIGAAFAAEIGKAAVGNAINSAIASSVDSAGASSALTKAFGALAIGTAAFSITTATLNILGSMTQKAGERAGANLTSTWQEYGAKKAEIMAGPGTAQEKAQALGELAKNTGSNVANIRESIGSLPQYLGEAAGMVGGFVGPLTGYAASKGTEWLFGSETAKGAEAGAAQFQAQLLKDQATAADMLAKAAVNLQKVTGNVSINTGSEPTKPSVK